jgi:hypothetical protein
VLDAEDVDGMKAHLWTLRPQSAHAEVERVFKIFLGICSDIQANGDRRRRLQPPASYVQIKFANADGETVGSKIP